MVKKKQRNGTSEEVKKIQQALKQSEKFLEKAKKEEMGTGVVSGTESAIKTFKKRLKGVRRKEKLKSVAEKTITGELKAFKKPFLRKPKAKGPTPISARKTLRSFAQSTGPMVREVRKREVIQDDRSQFFKQEFEQEERSVNKWLR